MQRASLHCMHKSSFPSAPSARSVQSMQGLRNCLPFQWAWPGHWLYLSILLSPRQGLRRLVAGCPGALLVHRSSTALATHALCERGTTCSKKERELLEGFVADAAQLRGLFLVSYSFTSTMDFFSLTSGSGPGPLCPWLCHWSGSPLTLSLILLQKLGP